MMIINKPNIPFKDWRYINFTFLFFYFMQNLCTSQVKMIYDSSFLFFLSTLSLPSITAITIISPVWLFFYLLLSIAKVWYHRKKKFANIKQIKQNTLYFFLVWFKFVYLFFFYIMSKLLLLLYLVNSIYGFFFVNCFRARYVSYKEMLR